MTENGNKKASSKKPLLTIPVSKSFKGLLKEAADSEGCSVTQFVKNAMVDKLSPRFPRLGILKEKREELERLEHESGVAQVRAEIAQLESELGGE
jgi:hypothetical protein